MSEAASHSREPTYLDYHARTPQRHASTSGRNRPEASPHSQQLSLNQVDAPEPVQNRPGDSAWHRQTHLEDESLESAPTPPSFRTRPSSSPPSPRRHPPSTIATQLYIVSHLVFFSLWGTLARLGMQWLTFYPGAPLVTPVL
ncbi:hypothetical protein KCU67_g14584, partial [Aureobasidium melanogenum]